MGHETQSIERGAIDDMAVCELAAAADVDVRSVVRRLAGLPVKGRSGRRIDEVLARRGIK